MTNQEGVQRSQPTTGHTPLPWRAATCGYLMGSDGTGPFGPKEVQVGAIGDFFTKDLLPYNRERWQADLELIVDAVNSHASLKARIEALEGALRECIKAFELVERPRRVDPDYGSEVNALGRRIGFGALMSSASASWRAALAADGDPVGGEFVAGPCHSTVIQTLGIARAALSSQETGK